MTEHDEIISDEALEYEQALATITAQRVALLAALGALLARMRLIRLSRPESDWPEAHATAMSEASTVIAAVKETERIEAAIAAAKGNA